MSLSTSSASAFEFYHRASRMTGRFILDDDIRRATEYPVIEADATAARPILTPTRPSPSTDGRQSRGAAMLMVIVVITQKNKIKVFLIWNGSYCLLACGLLGASVVHSRSGKIVEMFRRLIVFHQLPTCLHMDSTNPSVNDLLFQAFYGFTQKL